MPRWPKQLFRHVSCAANIRRPQPWMQCTVQSTTTSGKGPGGEAAKCSHVSISLQPTPEMFFSCCNDLHIDQSTDPCPSYLPMTPATPSPTTAPHISYPPPAPVGPCHHPSRPHLIQFAPPSAIAHTSSMQCTINTTSNSAPAPYSYLQPPPTPLAAT